jgi:8-oxo-dGTP diphosphatase
MSGRRYPDRPLVGVGAVLLSPGLDRVLLVQRGAPPARGKWSFPGGLVDAGEGLRRACQRELREETGLEAELQDLAVVVERIIPDERGEVEYHYVIVDFWDISAGEPEASSDASAVRWVPVDEVSRLETTRGVPEAIQRALALARGEATGSPLLED